MVPQFTEYDPLQVLRRIYDDAGNIIRVEVVSEPGLSADTDSISTRAVDESIYIDEASSTVTYTGYAAVGTATSAASWKIKKITVSGTVTSITYADGDTNYNNIWDNRASLSYS